MKSAVDTGILRRRCCNDFTGKSELVRLLNLYQADLLNQNQKNIENGRTEYFVPGVKAQYEHARIISTKLSVELGKGIKSWWEV